MQTRSIDVIESKCAPGVRFTIRRLNKTKRAKRDRAIAAERLQYSEACIAYVEEMRAGGYDLVDGKWARESKDPLPPDFYKRIAALDAETSQIFNEFIVPASIRAGLVSVENMAKDGELITTADALLECGPEADDIIDEIYVACEAAAGLNDAERPNSQSPTTSGAQVGDAINDSTAAPVSA